MNDRRNRRRVLAAFAATALAVTGVSCGVPTGDSSFEEIDGDVLGGLNDPTTTTTTSTTTTTTVPEPAPPTSSTIPVTEPPPIATAAIFFISRGKLSPQTREIDPLSGINELILLLEQGPIDSGVGLRLDTFVEPGLIVGTPSQEGGVIQVDLDGAIFDDIRESNQRQALAQIVVTLLQNTPAVGQVSFTRDGESILVPADGGSTEAASVDDFSSLLTGLPRSSNEPTDAAPTTTTTTTTVPPEPAPPPT